MGQDYVARKARKKQRKRMARGDGGDGRHGGGHAADRGEDGAPAAQKRVRKKANQPRRNCRGLCHQPAPVVTRADLRWDGRGPDPDGGTAGGGAGAGGSDDDFDAGQEAGARGDVFFGGGADDPLSPAEAAAEKYRRAYERRTGVKVAPAPGEEGAEAERSRLKLKMKKKKEQQQQKKSSSKKQKLSTGVRLLSNDDLAEAAEAAGGGGGGKSAAAAPTSSSSPDGTPLPPLLRPFPATLARAMALIGHEEPTPVQSAAWPVALKGRDLVAVAPTGSGKTLAFLLPAAVRALEAASAASASAAAAEQQQQPASPLALVLVPTRELAQQVFAQAKAACRAVAAAAAMEEEDQQQSRPAPPRAGAVFGGAPLAAQAAELAARPPAVLVATPGRLLALADLGALTLSRVRFAVLDEADRMLDAGFAPQLDRLAGMMLLAGGGAGEGAAAPAAAASSKSTSKRPQVLLFTATMPESVAAAARAWTRDGAARVDAEGAAAAALSASASAAAAAAAAACADPEAAAAAAAISPTVSQVAHVCADHKKPAKLLKHLRAVRQQAADAGKGRSPPRVLVFVNRIKTAVALRRALAEAPSLTQALKPNNPSSSSSSPDDPRAAPPAAPMRVEALHGARPQAERDAAVAAFRAGKCHVLVATDVASRGLDVKGLPYVVNYDCPVSLDSYAHRVGRTGRLAARGHAYTFLTRAQARLAPGLLAVLSACGQPADPNLVALAEAWREVEARLGPAAARAQGGAAAAAAGLGEGGEAEGDDDDEEEEEDKEGGGGAGGPEDLNEGLLQQQQQERQLRKAQEAAVLADVLGLPSLGKLAKRRAARAATGEDVMLVPSRPAAVAAGAGGAAGAASAASADSPSAPPNNGAPFVRSPRFRGAMPGYVFRRGDQGVGYYVDVSLDTLRAAMAAATGARPAAAANGGGGGGSDKKKSKAKQEQKKKPQGLAALPKLPGLAHRAADSDDDDGDDDDGSSGGELYRKAPPPPRKRAAPDSDSDGDGSDSDSDGGGGGGGRKRYKGALPGRLRKKLAKQRGAKAAGGGGPKAGRGAKAGGGGVMKGKGKGGGGRGAFNAGTSKAGRGKRV